MLFPYVAKICKSVRLFLTIALFLLQISYFKASWDTFFRFFGPKEFFLTVQKLFRIFTAFLEIAFDIELQTNPKRFFEFFCKMLNCFLIFNRVSCISLSFFRFSFLILFAYLLIIHNQALPFFCRCAKRLKTNKYLMLLCHVVPSNSQFCP